MRLKVLNKNSIKKAGIYIAVFAGVMLSYLNIHAQDRGAGLPGAYLRMGAGARALAMGGAFTGIADDASACYWNPAGIGQLKLAQIVASYQFLSMSRQYSYLSAVLPSRWKGTVGISWIRLGVNDIEARDGLGRETGSFSNAESAYMISWGVPVTERIYGGVTAKYFVHNLSDFQSTGYGFDFGLFVKIAKGLSAGAVLQNVGAGVKWNTESGLKEEFPSIIRGGIGVRPFTFPVTISMDAEYGSRFGKSLHAGCEWEIAGGFGLRAGFDKQGIKAGGFFSVPMRTFNFETNYSFGRDPVDSANMHRLSITITLAPFDYYFYRPRGHKGEQVSSFDVPDCRIVKIVAEYPGLGLINLGSDNGIKAGTRFHLYRQSADAEIGGTSLKKIGTVEAIRVESNLAAVKFIDNLQGYKIQVGDMLFRISR